MSWRRGSDNDSQSWTEMDGRRRSGDGEWRREPITDGHLVTATSMRGNRREDKHTTMQNTHTSKGEGHNSSIFPHDMCFQYISG